MEAEILVAGAGAAGLMAAFHASGRGRQVILAEKNQQPGLKILISGGGRCNLTTTCRGSDLELEYGPRCGRWLRHALRSFPPDALRSFVEEAGVPLQEESLGKIFPVSGRARDVLDALVRVVGESGAKFLADADVEELRVCDEGFRVRLSGQREVKVQHIVLATGGCSYPKTGTTGIGYRLCRELGHRIIEPRPHLAPLAVDLPWVQSFSGMTVEDAELSLRDGRGNILCRRRRPFLFTHRGLSGPAAMDLAGFVEEAEGSCELSIDLAPDMTEEEIDRSLQEAARAGHRRTAQRCLPLWIPERLRYELARQADAGVAISDLTRDARRRLVAGVKSTRLMVDRSLGFAHAEVTRGGVCLDEIDPRTMESKIVPGLFVCGELLDVDGPIGGFNFQAAFATGRLAGLSA